MYADDLKAALDRKLSVQSPRLLGDYIAASGPIHCVDAWSYLGRAIAAELKGDEHASLHLAYYAELRAAMSLMAAQGVGVFLSRHYVLDDAGHAHQLGHLSKGKKPRLSTHQAMWFILEHWAGLQRSASLVGELISVNGVTADEWLRNSKSGTSLRPIAQEWFRAWGVDLRAMSLDRDARNVVSYRPTQMRDRPGFTLSDSVDFLEAFWRLLEPQPGAPFAGLDQHLVRGVMEYAHYSGGVPTPSRRDELRRRTTEAGETAGLSTAAAESIAGFVARDVDPGEHYVLERATDAATEGPLKNRGPMCRAVLLGRMATGAWTSVLLRAGISWTDLSFWWDDFGHRRGYWESGTAPDLMADLWPQVAEALDDAGIVVASFGGSVEAWNAARPLAAAFTVLDGVERVSLWGLSA